MRLHWHARPCPSRPYRTICEVLREAGLVEIARKRGTWVHYRLVPDAVAELALALGTQRGAEAAAA